MKILSVVGARPNFMKIAPFINAINTYNKLKNKYINHVLVHTGQHYENRMNASFFQSLNIPKPDINLEIGSGSHAEQVGKTMIAFEKVLLHEIPDWVVVVGDVNATLSCSVTAKKMNIKVCHIEAGLRSGDMSMPEEINRLVTDCMSDLLMTPDRLSAANLLKEGINKERIHFVGNIMIDTLESNRETAEKLDTIKIVEDNCIQENHNQQIPDIREGEPYAVITLHRPSNVDFKEIFNSLVDFICNDLANEMKVLWPLHPRAILKLNDFGLWEKVVNIPNLFLLNPVGYHEMLNLTMNAKIMITDSGGLQEECCIFTTPCLTLRWNTERPVTLIENGGTSYLTGNNIKSVREMFRQILTVPIAPVRPELWDGRTAERIVKILLNESSK